MNILLAFHLEFSVFILTIYQLFLTVILLLNGHACTKDIF